MLIPCVFWFPRTEKDMREYEGLQLTPDGTETTTKKTRLQWETYRATASKSRSNRQRYRPQTKKHTPKLTIEYH